MTATPHLINADAVTPAERTQRITVARRERRSGRARLYRRFFFWPGALAVLALLCLAIENVQHRDQVLLLKERHALELAEKDRELALYRPEPRAMHCRNYTTVPYDQAVERSCHRTVTRM